MRIVLAVIHLLGMGIALGAIFARGRAASRLRGNATTEALRRLFAADNWWGVSALLLVGTGLWRAFTGTEKSPSYYWGSQAFWAKMGLLAVVLALEVWPMVTLIRWRVAHGRGSIDLSRIGATAGPIARISDVQLLLLITMVVAATLLARGYFA